MEETVNNDNEKIILGYARVSTPQQRLTRQIENMKKLYPEIVIVEEKCSGKTQNRPKWKKVMNQCRAGKISKLVFDEVSRFGRNAEEAVKEYKELYELGIELEFIKEPHINSSVYRDASSRRIDIDTTSMDEETAKLINAVINGLNDYLFAVAEKQIFLAFDRAEKERIFLSTRTSEGLREAKALGSKVGRQTGDKIITRKSIRVKKKIKKRYEEFGGDLTATECFKIFNVSKSTFYRYVKEIEDEESETSNETDENVKKDSEIREELV